MYQEKGNWNITPEEIKSCRTHNGEGLIDLEAFEKLAKSKIVAYIALNCKWDKTYQNIKIPAYIYDKLLKNFRIEKEK